jgi:hypothetical protein
LTGGKERRAEDQLEKPEERDQSDKGAHRHAVMLKRLTIKTCWIPMPSLVI